MPPRHGKSEYSSKYLPAWFIGTYPEKRVILTSYEATFAASWGRKARNLLEEFGGDFGVQVAKSPSAADQWDVEGRGGGMVTAGAGGAITGKGAHLAIIDDPIKNAEEAASQTIRDKIWEWWQSTLYTRLEPDGVVIVIQTRWHEDDLCGRLKQEARTVGGERWRILNLPAILNDGSALWPERYSLDRLNQIKRSVGSYYWESLYQQNPTAREGSFFKVNRLNFIDEQPFNLQCVRAWDLAATEGDGDYSAGVKIGKDADGRIFICDVQRGQWASDERDKWIKYTAGSDGKQCKIRIAQDPGQAGKSQALQLTRMLSGYVVKSEVVSGDKSTRADGYSSQVNGGNVWIVKGPWNRDYIEELRQFPKGKHDDQVDGSSDAFNELTAVKKVWIPQN
jgi:predicted phage terminase large subunit-like protein